MEQEELFTLQDTMENASDEERMSTLLLHFPTFKLLTTKVGCDDRGANKYRVTIKNSDKKFNTTFTDSLYNTYNNTPSSTIHILYCIIMDAQCYDNYSTLEDFADNMGYDLYEERKKAEKCFYACEKTYNSIIDLFGYEGFEILNCITYGM